MEKMTQAQRMALAREMAVNALNLPEGKVQVGTSAWAFETEAGYVKVTVTAVKNPDYDPNEENAEFEFERAEARAKADKRKAEAEAKKAANLAKKAREKAAKGE